ncbi:MAG: molybdopterin synthase sulfur carrier subunit [Oscillatoriales cyanobacterium CG2_30_44_21]|nr:MAG: molybdopterin synthase sulfur carrier subunit [Oscillatoriales cyanobacterium CG2_30_44_21]
MNQTIQVTVKLFAIFQETLAKDQIQIDMPSGASVLEVFEYLADRHPSLEKWRSLTRYAINLSFVEPQTTLQSGDEVALIPPVSGG